jgi:hypothetical protein
MCDGILEEFFCEEQGTISLRDTMRGRGVAARGKVVYVKQDQCANVIKQYWGTQGKILPILIKGLVCDYHAYGTIWYPVCNVVMGMYF